MVWNECYRINPILGGLWNYVTGRRVGGIMAWMDFSHLEAVCRHPKAQKWLPSNFFDLWLSIDTKNSTLWAVVLANPAVKRPWQKMKIFMQKYVKIENFWYMRVIYIKRKLRTCTIQIQKEKVWFFPKKKIFFIFSIFFPKGDPLMSKSSKNFFPFFKNFKNKTQKWLSWDHSNINRNKVRNFGGRSSYPAETARLFTVVRAIMPPPTLHQNGLYGLHSGSPGDFWKFL